MLRNVAVLPQNTPQENGEAYANYFRFCVRDVTKSHHHMIVCNATGSNSSVLC